jgi:SAM-dependent methyltransferase
MTEIRQKDAFTGSEADAWYRRNRVGPADVDEKGREDRVLRAFRQAQVAPRKVLEVGCSNGWRLECLRREYGAECFGIEPSSEAVADAKALFPEVRVVKGTADELPAEDGEFDAVILGFFLYLCDRQDLFRIACEVDRALSDPGYLFVYDFFSPTPYRNRYRHKEGLFSYKMDYSRLFDWNPAYTRIHHVVFAHPGAPDVDDPDWRLAVTVLRKCLKTAYPDNPFS